MKFLKPFFISSYFLLAAGAAAISLRSLFQGEDRLSWIGVLLTWAPMLIFLARILIFKDLARTSARLPWIHALTVAGVASSVFRWNELRGTALPLAWALSGWLGFLFYVYWYSNFGARSPNFRVGKRLPSFRLKNLNGEIWDGSSLAGRPAILIFFRGNWCPLCMAQIKEIARQYREIESLGVRVLLVSPQPHDQTESLAKKFDVNFEFMVDEGNLAARALGIAQKEGLPMGLQMLGYDSETVMPTVVILDKDGVVIWAHETDNYRSRPEPEIYLEILRRHGFERSPS